MQASKKAINDIFNGNRLLEIPFFQRAYVWGEEQWERLLEDMQAVSGDDTSSYFMGSVILKQQQTSTSHAIGDLRTVIDGQQRLTTLCIFFKVLGLKRDDLSYFNQTFRIMGREVALRHNHSDILAFNQIVALTSLEKVNGDNRVVRAYEYFRENLDPNSLNIFSIINRIQFVGIDLNHDEDEQQIFDTIISQILNTSIRDSNWDTKKEGRSGKGGLKQYAEGIETFSHYLTLSGWDETAIGQRAEFLYQQALGVWPI